MTSSAPTQPPLSREARLFLTGIFLTNLGNGLYVLAVGKLLYTWTHSVLGYGLVLLSEFLFKLLLQGIDGLDGVSSVWICRVADICRGLALLMAAGLLLRKQGLPAVVLATGAIQLFKPFYITAAFRLATQFNDPVCYERYNAAFGACKQAGLLAGVFLFGVWGSQVHPVWMLVLNGLSYGAMVLLLFLIRPTPREPQTQTWKQMLSMRQGWRQALSLLRNPAFLHNAVAASFDQLVLTFVSLVVVPMSQVWFAQTASALAWLQGGFLLGMVASVYATPKSSHEPALQGRRWLLWVAAEFTLIVILCCSRWLVLSVATLALLGMTTSTAAAHHTARLMRACTPAQKGPVARVLLLVVAVLLSVNIPLLSASIHVNLTWAFVYLLPWIAAFGVFLWWLPAVVSSQDLSKPT